MTQTVRSHIGDNQTSVFTLPSPRKLNLKQRQEKQQQQHQQQSPCQPTTAPLHSKAAPAESYGEVPSSNSINNHNSPTLPWLVEYWSTSFFQGPEMVLNQLCSCTSAVEPPGIEVAHTIGSNSVTSNNSKAYFDDTILRSDPKVDRSPTKISPTRWEALRGVVASQGDYTVQDYCDFYEKTVETMPSIEETKEEYDNARSIYPTKNNVNIKLTTAKTRSLMDNSKDEDDIEDMEIEIGINEDDDIRAEPPATTDSEREHSFMEIHTCHSFDQYVVEPSRRFLCASETIASTPVSTPVSNRNSMAPPLSPPATRLPDRRRNRQASLSQISPRALGFQTMNNASPTRTRLTPPSPAPSAADTYTTISLSQSFAKEFDEDNSEDDVFLQRMVENGGNLFLDRLAAETIAHSPSRSPFRRLRPRTTMPSNNNNNININSNGQEKEERQDLENHYPSTPSRKQTATSDEDDDRIDYRCLVRMSPDNYKHGGSKPSFSLDDDWCENHLHQFPKPEESATSVTSSVTSSVLLPLHPHQRIMAPLFDIDSFDPSFDDFNDHSGYTCFRDQTQQHEREITVPNF